MSLYGNSVCVKNKRLRNLQGSSTKTLNYFCWGWCKHRDINIT